MTASEITQKIKFARSGHMPTALEKLEASAAKIAAASRAACEVTEERRRIQANAAPIGPKKYDVVQPIPEQFGKIVSCMKLLAMLFKTTMAEKKNYFEVTKLSGTPVMRFYREDGRMEFFMQDSEYGRKIRKQLDYIEKLGLRLSGGEKVASPSPLKANVDVTEKIVAEVGTEKVHQPLAYTPIRTSSGKTIGCAEATTFYGKGYTEKSPRSKGARMKGCRLTSGVCS